MQRVPSGLFVVRHVADAPEHSSAGSWQLSSGMTHAAPFSRNVFVSESQHGPSVQDASVLSLMQTPERHFPFEHCVPSGRGTPVGQISDVPRHVDAVTHSVVLQLVPAALHRAIEMC